jgi:hypothetical protein
MKMYYSNYAWFRGASVGIDEECSGYCILIFAYGFCDRKMIPNSKDGIRVHTIIQD